MSTAASQSRPQVAPVLPAEMNLCFLESLEQRLLLDGTQADLLSSALLVYNNTVMPVGQDSNIEYAAQARASGNPVRPNPNATYLFGVGQDIWNAAYRSYIQDMSWWYGCSPTADGMQASWYDHFVAGDLYPGNQHEWVYGRYPAQDSYIFDVPDFPNGVVSSYAHLYDGRYTGSYYDGYAYDENGLFHAPDSIADFMLTSGDSSLAENIRWGIDNFNAWDDPATPDINESWSSYSYFLDAVEQPDEGWAHIRRFDDGTIGLNPAYQNVTPQAWTDYVAEINAGRPVHMLLVDLAGVAHSVLGVGYYVDTSLNNDFPMDPGIAEPNAWKLNYILFSGWNTDVEMWNWRSPIDFALGTPQTDPEAIHVGNHTDYMWHYILRTGATPADNGYMENATGYDFWVNDNIGTDFAHRDPFTGAITRPGSPGNGDLTGYLDVMLSQFGADSAQDWQITIGLGDPTAPLWSINVPITHWGRTGSGITAADYPSGDFGRDILTYPTANNVDETTKSDYHFVLTDIDLNAAADVLKAMSANGGQESWFLQVVDTNSVAALGADPTEVARILDFQIRYKEFQEDSWFTPERGKSVTDADADANGVSDGAVVHLTSQVYADVDGVVYHDYNGNHVQDPGEPGLAGVTVFIDNNLDGVDNGLSTNARDATDQNGVLDPGEPFTVTDANGHYSFNDLTPTTYQIRVDETTLPGNDWVQSQPGIQTAHALASNYESTVEGGYYQKVDFGYYRLGTLSGLVTSLGTPLAGWRVFLDENNNGIWDGTPLDLDGDGIWTDGHYIDRNGNGKFDWYDTNGNGLYDAGEQSPEVELSIVTGADGTFTFSDVPPGDYNVSLVLKDGWIETVPGSRLWTDVPPVTGTFYPITLTSYDPAAPPPIDTLNVPNLDFDAHWAPLPDLTEGALTRVAIPSVVNPGAPFLINWDVLNIGDIDTTGSFVIRFYASADDSLATTDDNYFLGDVTISQSLVPGGDPVLATLELQALPNLLPGVYYLRAVIDPALPDQADPTMQQGQILERYEDNNATLDNVDVQFVVPGIRGSRWADFNGNGVRDAGEPGVPGQMFYLDANGNGLLDTGERTSTTDINGDFGFSNLAPGTYLVREVLGAGWQRTYPLSDRYGVPYTQDGLITGVDFGAKPLADLTADSTDYSTFNPHSVYPPGQSWNIWWDIKNLGTVGSGAFTVDFYATNRPGATTIDPALDAYLGSVNVANVTAGGYVDVNLALINFPSLTPGSYHVGVVIDPTNQVWESNETPASNNTVDPTDELVIFGRPELSTDLVGMNTYTPAVITPGVRNSNDPLFEITWTIHNTGQGSTEDGGIVPGCGFFVQFYASDNPDITTFDYYLGKVWVANLDGQDYVEIRLPMFNFPDIPAGDYYIGAIIDRPNWIDEPIESNNVTATEIYPLRVPGIAGQVVHDTNNDGTKDASESARPGMPVYLDLNGNGVWDFQDLNGDGVWDFVDTNGNGVQDFVDANANGVWDAGENYIESLEPFEPFEITDSFGQYSFTSLNSGQYSVKMITPWIGAELQYAPDPVVPAFVDDQVIGNVDFYKTLYSRADGFVWYDYNGNGIYEPGAPWFEGLMDGWRVFIDSNNNDKLDWVDNPLNPNVGGWDPGEGERWFVTGSFPGAWDGGLWQFKKLLALSPLVTQYDQSGLNPDPINPDPRNTEYNIRVVPEAFWVMTYPTDFENSVSVTSAHVYPEQDFGEAHAARITGTVWHDLNVNQVHGQNEPGLSGWTVYLDQNDDGILNAWEVSTLTDGNGKYLFENLLPGNYNVRMLLPTDWNQSVPTNNGANVVFAGSSVTVTGVDFAAYQYAQIKGTVWHDIDADRVHRPEEPGLENWVVYLDANDDGQLNWNDLNNNNLYDAGEGEYWTYTDADGNYTFAGLMPGQEYVVRELVANGWAQSAPEFFYHRVYVASGDVITGVEFGNYMPGSIFGFAFNDLNGNGAWEATEPGLEGWTVFLDQNGNGRLDDGEIFTTTAADGSYGFVNLTPSSYRVVQILRDSNWVQTFPPTNLYTLTITSGMNWINADFGDYKYGTISGTKWEDANANGLWDWTDTNKNGVWDTGEGERPLSGWTIFLDANGNGLLDAGERSTVTNANGAYSFTRLSPGDYYVTEVLQAGWIESYPAVLASNGFRQHQITVISESVITGANFGNYQAGQIRGVKWNDVNGNGLMDVTEPGLADVVVYLDTNNNHQLDWVDDSTKPNFGRWDFGEGEQWTTTNSTGAYTLNNLTPGIYTVAEVVPDGWIQSYPLESTGLPDQAGILIASGTVVQNINFGNYQYGRVTGMSWNDLNGNGLKDVAEPGLPGWVVIAFPDLDLDGVIDPAEMILSTQVTTGADGSYEIIGLKIGQYIVAEGSKDNWAQTYPAGNGLSIVHILSGTVVSGINFGNVQLGKISGTVWHDLNANGLWDWVDVNGSGDWTQGTDTGEPPLSAWIVLLDDNGNGQRDWTDINHNFVWDEGEGERWMFSSAIGTYTFDNLLPGTYNVTLIQQANWIRSFPASATQVTTVASGENLTGRNFGEYQNGSISGTKWSDLDADGVKDAGEPGLPGWTIYIDANADRQLNWTDANANGVWDAGEGEQWTVTAADGSYTFPALKPDTYIVREVNQPSWIQMAPANNTRTAIVVSSQVTPNTDFGNVLSASISGLVWRDVDANGIMDAGNPFEAPLADWQIYLDTNQDGNLNWTDANANGVWDAGEGEQWTTTDANGVYLFTGLLPNRTYTVATVLQNGFLRTYPLNGVYDVTVQAGDAIVGRDFGMKQLPAAGTLALTTDEDVPATGVMPANSPDGSPLTWIVDSYPIHGQLAFNATDGSFTYTPNQHYNGVDSFTFHVDNGTARSSTGRVDLTVRPVNQVPNSQDQLVRVINGRTITITLLGTDLETAFDQLVFRILSGPSSGTLTRVDNGSYLYTPYEGFCGVDSFVYDVTDTGDPAGSMQDPKTSATATVTINVVRAVDLPANTVVPYTDADGDIVRVRLSGGGSGTLMFAGTGWADLDYLYLTGTTTNSALTITTNHSTTVRDIGVAGPLKSITATTTDLTGNITLGGGLAQIRMRNVVDPALSGPVQHTISIGANGRTTATNITFQAIYDLTLVSQSPIGTFQFKDWTDRIGPVDSIQALYISSLTSSANTRLGLMGNFPASLDLTSQLRGVSLQRASIAGILTSPTMIMPATGAVGTITAAAWPTGYLEAAYASSLTIRGDFGADINLTGQNASGISLNTLSVTGRVSSASIMLHGAGGNFAAGAWAAEDTTAFRLNNLTSKGDFIGNLSLGGQASNGLSLANLSVTGRLLNSEIRTRGGIGTIRVGSLINTKVFVSASATLTGLPTNGNADFLPSVLASRPAGIGQLNMSDRNGLFQNSIIVAPTMGTVILRGVQTNNGLHAFGLAAHSKVSSLTRYIPNARSAVARNIVTSLANDQDFDVEIV